MRSLFSPGGTRTSKRTGITWTRELTWRIRKGEEPSRLDTIHLHALYPCKGECLWWVGTQEGEHRNHCVNSHNCILWLFTLIGCTWSRTFSDSLYMDYWPYISINWTIYLALFAYNFHIIFIYFSLFGFVTSTLPALTYSSAADRWKPSLIVYFYSTFGLLYYILHWYSCNASGIILNHLWLLVTSILYLHWYTPIPHCFIYEQSTEALLLYLLWDSLAISFNWVR